ncbi:MAG: glycosyltransferase family 2 protein [Alphaproteobacteria bacterium]
MTAAEVSPIQPVPVVDRIVDVCLCTFRRPSVADTLASLAAQQLPAGVRMRVIVADNDEQPTARELVEQAFGRLGLDGRYIHAPARNISIARNACLDAVTAPLTAFLDDDEAAHPDWLATLLHRLDEENVDVVFGRVAAIYAPDAPKWMVDGDLHSTEAVIKQGEIDGGYTCNVIFRAAVLGSRRFDLALGRTGGEDTTFFSELFMSGAKAAYAPDAVVEEPVPASRSSLGWLMRRFYRSGQTRATVLMMRGRTRLWLASTGVLKIMFCGATMLARCYSPSSWRKAAVRAALHAGVTAGALGRAPLELY